MFFVLSLVFACQLGEIVIENPSGECEAETDGSRLCYHSPNPTDTYLPDCDNTLDRELWRVFAQTEESAYVIPRPDAIGLRFELCDGESEDALLLEEYKLCKETLGIEDLDIINNIPPEDALKITNILHQNLRFEEIDGAISPWAPDEDMIEACALINNSLVDDHCEMLENQEHQEECLDIDYELPEGSVPLFVDALNLVYGIE